ncbi:MAG: competence/damage-inducible protein A [Planctomycetota bacterium]|nr:MAG: competence/damage-inducible protein A [Planctomycetota bacterium]
MSARFDHVLAAVVAVGDELVLGQKLDTNSRWIADRLVLRGLDVAAHLTVPDDVDAISSAIRRFAERVELLILTGGLGPTADDLTRAALAAALDEQLVLDERALEQVRLWFTSRGREMPEQNRAQALRPQTARMLRNDHGTAPALHAILDNRCDIFCLPGPPHEMQPIFERDIEPTLRLPPERAVHTTVIHTFGRGESDVAAQLADLMDRSRNPLVGTTASLGVVSVRIRARGPDGPQRLRETESLVRTRLSEILLDDESLAVDVLNRLKARQQTVATVESCTGGLVGEMLTSIPGSSQAFVGGLITYTNELKHRLADVPHQVFETEGAVSKPCAIAMAEGGRAHCHADHAIAITGIAGPDGGTDAKPVGTVWIAVASENAPTDARRFLFKGSRQAIRTWSAATALGMLRLRLAGHNMRLLNQQEP